MKKRMILAVMVLGTMTACNKTEVAPNLWEWEYYNEDSQLNYLRRWNNCECEQTLDTQNQYWQVITSESCEEQYASPCN